MKKSAIVILIGMLMMAAGAYVAFAQPAWAQRQGRPMRWQGNGRGPKTMCPMHMMMLRTMTEKEMEVAPDGNVIVLVGCQLFKYDPQLNLITRTQIDVDFEAIQKKMQQVMENCPMLQDQQENSNTDDNNNQN